VAFNQSSNKSNSRSAAVPGPAGTAPSAGAERPDFALAELLGQELAQPLSDMQSALQDIETNKNFTRDDFNRLSASIKSARKLAMQSQQIARLAGGRLRQSHENLKLDAMVLAAMQERSREFRKKGIEIFQRIRPVEVIVDAGLLHSLIDAAFDWAAGLGSKLTVTLEMQNWPEHGLLTFKTKRAVSGRTIDSQANETEGDPSRDSVGWYLISEIAQAMGLLVNRTSSDQETRLVVEFSRTVKRLEGLTVVEMESGPESLYGNSRPMSGSRILLITDDVRLQLEVRQICTGTGMVLDSVANASHAVRFCEMESPTLVIIDEYMRDPVFEQLHQDLRNRDPNFPFIEIAATPNTFEMAGWTSESMSRLSKDALQMHLATILAAELTKVI
jgi:CheY-like chemotaxis protein